jgi:hypothetical protein
MLRWQPQRMPTHTRASLESNSRLTPTLSRARTLTCANVLCTLGLQRCQASDSSGAYRCIFPGNAAGRNLCLALFSQENTENSPAEFVLADRRLGSTVGPGVDAKIGVTLRRRRLKIQNRIGCPHTVFPTPLNDTTTRIFRLCLASCRSLNSPSAGRDVARTDQNRDRCKTMRVPSRRN